MPIEETEFSEPKNMIHIYIHIVERSAVIYVLYKYFVVHQNQIFQMHLESIFRLYLQ